MRIVLFVLGSALVLGIILVTLWETFNVDDLDWRERTNRIHRELERELDDIEFPAAFTAVGMRRTGCVHPVVFLCSSPPSVLRSFHVEDPPAGREILDPLRRALARQGFEGGPSCSPTFRRGNYRLRVSWSPYRDYYDERADRFNRGCPKSNWRALYAHAWIEFARTPDVEG